MLNIFLRFFDLDGKEKMNQFITKKGLKNFKKFSSKKISQCVSKFLRNKRESSFKLKVLSVRLFYKCLLEYDQDNLDLLLENCFLFLGSKEMNINVILFVVKYVNYELNPVDMECFFHHFETIISNKDEFRELIYTILVNKKFFLYEESNLLNACYYFMTNGDDDFELTENSKNCINELNKIFKKFKNLPENKFIIGKECVEITIPLEDVNRKYVFEYVETGNSIIFEYMDKLIKVEKKVTTSVGILTELHFLKRLLHENIIRVESFVVLRKDNIPISYGYKMEYRGCDIETLLNKKDIILNLKLISTQLLNVLCYLHKYDIIHNDIKESNILFDVSTNKICLIDFALSFYVGSTTVESVCSKFHRPPEFIFMAKKDHYFDQFIDIWAAGCVFLGILNRQIFFQCNDLKTFLEKKKYETYTPFIRKMVCWRKDRETAEMILKQYF